MEQKMRSKRVAIPKLNASDVSDLDADKDVEEDTSSTRKHLRAVISFSVLSFGLCFVSGLAKLIKANCFST